MKKLICAFLVIAIFVSSNFSYVLASNLSQETSPQLLINSEKTTKTTESTEVFWGDYTLDGVDYKIEIITDLSTNERKTTVSDSKSISIHHSKDNFITYNNEKIYFEVTESSINENNLSNNLLSPSYASTYINWMPIRTDWYTYKANQYIGQSAISFLSSLILTRFGGPAGVALTVALTVKQYHEQVYALRYKKDWKLKKTYCGAQGYYNKYAYKYWHYTITGVYIPNTYNLIELY
ncbi:hypothetical protein [Alkalibacter saccharofermentans]|uniref:Uncharacterized protein n=1 Tax=Alkalibacter saccharofermentans DSM 14828 TaxID=1120975 RepID=A0A1M4W0J6_9FIRM|nr:hypothetical protein [Alkalibacter saccharofermentans]SHE74739.1 hypothetical protein SAMN02746064_01122 [Alkalibacter saccharofermentans DSM 14828]